MPVIEEVTLNLKNSTLGISVAIQDGAIFIYHIEPGNFVF